MKLALPITPRFMSDTIILGTIDVSFNPTWDGVAWVLNPVNIILQCRGQLAENGVNTLPADLKITASDLPPAGQSALTDLYNYIEGEMQTKYDP